MSNAAPTSTHTPGTVVHSADAGHARIDIIKAVGGWTVVVWQGTERVVDWTASYGTKRDAWEASKHAQAAFTTHGSARGIDTHRQRLAITRGQLEDRRSRLHDTDARARLTAELDRLDAQLAAVEDLRTRNLRPQLVEHVVRHLTNAA